MILEAYEGNDKFEFVLSETEQIQIKRFAQNAGFGLARTCVDTLGYNMEDVWRFLKGTETGANFLSDLKTAISKGSTQIINQAVYANKAKDVKTANSVIRVASTIYVTKIIPWGDLLTNDLDNFDDDLYNAISDMNNTNIYEIACGLRMTKTELLNYIKQRPYLSKYLTRN